MKHRHHILPKHRGGSDDPSNLVSLTVEQHAKAHWVEFMLEGHTNDLIAYMALSNLIDKSEIHAEIMKSPEYRAKLRRAQKGHKGTPHTEEHKKWIGEINKVKQKGKRNSQYGTMWVNDGTKDFKVKKYCRLPAGIRIGRLHPRGETT